MAGPLEVSRRRVGVEDLAKVPLFRHVERSALTELTADVVELRVARFSEVFRQGDLTTGLWIVGSGKLASFRDAEGFPVQLLERYGPGDLFGEVALVAESRCSETVRATQESTVLRLAGATFGKFLRGNPSIEEQLQDLAARRHSQRLAAALELGRRREVRMRSRRPVVLELSSGTYPAVVENLSLGGICLSSVPEGWQVGDRVPFSLHLPDGSLPLAGEIRWRQGDQVGIAFDPVVSSHDVLVQTAIRWLLESPQ